MMVRGFAGDLLHLDDTLSRTILCQTPLCLSHVIEDSAMALTRGSDIAAAHMTALEDHFIDEI